MVPSLDFLSGPIVHFLNVAPRGERTVERGPSAPPSEKYEAEREVSQGERRGRRTVCVEERAPRDLAGRRERHKKDKQG